MFSHLKQEIAKLTFFSALGYIVFVSLIAVVATAGSLLVVQGFKETGKFDVRLTTPQDAHTIIVDGEAIIETVPDQANLSVGITSQATTVKSAQDKTNQAIATIRQGVKDLGIDDKKTKTTNYSVYPNYDYSGSVSRIVGYTVSQNLNITVEDFEKLNQIIDLATAGGANQIGGISFSLSDAKQKELEKQARTEAIAIAKDKATALAQGAGIKLGQIVGVYENNNYNDAGPMYKAAGVMTNEMTQLDNAATGVDAGSTNYVYSVSLTYELV
jgi:uncharacterized protein YggE